MTKHR